MIEDLPECLATLDPPIPADTGLAFDRHAIVDVARRPSRLSGPVRLLTANTFACHVPRRPSTRSSPPGC